MTIDIYNKTIKTDKLIFDELTSENTHVQYHEDLRTQLCLILDLDSNELDNVDLTTENIQQLFNAKTDSKKQLIKLLSDKPHDGILEMTVNDLSIIKKMLDNGFEVSINPNKSIIIDEVEVNVEFVMMFEDYPQLHNLIVKLFLKQNRPVIKEIITLLLMSTDEDYNFILYQVVEIIFGKNCFDNHKELFSVFIMLKDHLTPQTIQHMVNSTNIYDFSKIVPCILITGKMPPLCFPSYTSEFNYYENSWEILRNHFTTKQLQKYYALVTNVADIESPQMFDAVLHDNTLFPYFVNKLTHSFITSTVQIQRKLLNGLSDNGILKLFQYSFSSLNDNTEMKQILLDNLVDKSKLVNFMIEYSFYSIYICDDKKTPYSYLNVDLRTTDAVKLLKDISDNMSVIDDVYSFIVSDDTLRYLIEEKCTFSKSVLDKAMNGLISNEKLKEHRNVLLEYKSYVCENYDYIQPSTKSLFESVVVEELYNKSIEFDNSFDLKIDNYKFIDDLGVENWFEKMYHKNKLDTLEIIIMNYRHFVDTTQIDKLIGSKFEADILNQDNIDKMILLINDKNYQYIMPLVSNKVSSLYEFDRLEEKTMGIFIHKLDYLPVEERNDWLSKAKSTFGITTDII